MNILNKIRSIIREELEKSNTEKIEEDLFSRKGISNKIMVIINNHASIVNLAADDEEGDKTFESYITPDQKATLLKHIAKPLTVVSDHFDAKKRAQSESRLAEGMLDIPKNLAKFAIIDEITKAIDEQTMSDDDDARSQTKEQKIDRSIAVFLKRQISLPLQFLGTQLERRIAKKNEIHRIFNTAKNSIQSPVHGSNYMGRDDDDRLLAMLLIVLRPELKINIEKQSLAIVVKLINDYGIKATAKSVEESLGVQDAEAQASAPAKQQAPMPTLKQASKTAPKQAQKSSDDVKTAVTNVGPKK